MACYTSPMKLPVLATKTSLKGKRVLVRVDWNIPQDKHHEPEDTTKIERDAPFIAELLKRGATVIAMTHLGRPKKPDQAFSTKHLLRAVEHFVGTKPTLLTDPDSKRMTKGVNFFLLENVRFFSGEEKNDKALAKKYALLGEMFVNDAFASCHRTHASVVGVTKLLPSYAGPSLEAEVEGLSHLLDSPKHPFIACIGGAKLSTKMEVITSLLPLADRILIGGAMAHPFFVAKKLKIGKSYLEKASVPLAKKLLKNPKIVLPTDIVVATGLNPKTAHVVPLKGVRASSVIADIGTETMMAWSREFKGAKTIMWNGPVGVAEVPAFSHGSRVIAQAIASRSKGPCFGVVGGGDTLPIVERSGMGDWIDHVSTGGGAMLEFIALKGKLPGLVALSDKK